MAIERRMRLLPQDIEDVKVKMKALAAREGTMPKELYDRASQQLLMELYRVTGPAKVDTAIEHITHLLKQGGRNMVLHLFAVRYNRGTFCEQ